MKLIFMGRVNQMGRQTFKAGILKFFGAPRVVKVEGQPDHLDSFEYKFAPNDIKKTFEFAEDDGQFFLQNYPKVFVAPEGV